jgi:hypothetical protein
VDVKTCQASATEEYQQISLLIALFHALMELLASLIGDHVEVEREIKIEKALTERLILNSALDLQSALLIVSRHF